MFVDGAFNTMGVGASIIIISPKGVKVEHSLRLGFRASNNEAEYDALLAWLKVALSLGPTNLEVYSDSRLVVSQVKGSFGTKDSRMTDYLNLVKQMMSKFQEMKIVQISRG